MPRLVCRECREGVAEGASSCPHCGYTAGSEYEGARRVYGLVGFLSAITIIGLPISLVCIWQVWRLEKRMQRATVGVEA